ncbi:hypothetical protein E2P64_00580 [Candidatus Bathyarchaeota archaeon]|nr:hypothetical protein E2P64_00580 [Candidatus Bathyarchaeota archaeon]
MRPLWVFLLLCPVFAQLSTDCDACLNFQSTDNIVVRCSTILVKNRTRVELKEGMALSDGERLHVGEVILEEGTYQLVNLSSIDFAAEESRRRNEFVLKISLLIVAALFLFSF